MKNNKLKLDELKVKSFVTVIKAEEKSDLVKGGAADPTYFYGTVCENYNTHEAACWTANGAQCSD